MSLANDKITLIKKSNGDKIEGIKSSLQRNRLYVLDNDNRHKIYTIEIGDIVERTVRGVLERYRITEPNYHSSSGSLSGYQSYIERFDTGSTVLTKQETDKIIILCVSSDPKDEGRLRLGEEVRSIRERIETSRFRDKFVFEARPSIRITDFVQAIHDVKPNIIHFSGHGGSGEICFEDASGFSKTVPPNSLQRLFDAIEDPVLCVVINACESEPQANAISQQVPYVIGMETSISDEAAIAFSTGFYMALANGKSCESAFKFATAQVAMETPGEEDIPKLYNNSAMVSKITLNLTEGAIKISNFQSSNIKSFSYDNSNQLLEVEFQSGGVYAYNNVPNNLFQDFKNALSKGEFHEQKIKNQFPFKKLN